MAEFESQADDCPLIVASFFIKKTEKRVLDLGVLRIPEPIRIQPLFFSGSGTEADFFRGIFYSCVVVLLTGCSSGGATRPPDAPGRFALSALGLRFLGSFDPSGDQFLIFIA
ncbi:hypothetical protein [uncultured Bilophila sp.]|uniref:hypothetical protein n=1 Tax=uncultured Bilophila sp. TaxID=529385 RepID=UPI00266F6BC7|nr:hypothetical protein [uncultured Bilophila sp.]